MPSPIDPSSPVPLYHQIAEALRARMERGELRAGDALDPMRQAAERWGVNLHTVRHAYAALAREGLLEMRTARGTRVTAKARRLNGSDTAGLEAFVTRTTQEARDRFGISAGELAARITAGVDRPSTVAVVECSAWQCESHAAELTARWQVEAQPWPLDDEREPHADAVVATYFHYNDIRLRWPRLLERVHFLTIRVDPALEAWLGKARSAKIMERDLPTAEAVAADLRAVLKHDLDLQLIVTDDPAAAVTGKGRCLFSPRIWSELDEATRADKRCSVVRYEFDAGELEAAATTCGWKSRVN